MADREPFHQGEIAVQERTGERAVAVRHGAMIRDLITPPARTFLASQRTVAFGALDEQSRPWASLWLGEPGMVTSDDGRVVLVSLDARSAQADDPLPALLVTGRSIGMLAIDLTTRRRLRVNGVIAAASKQHLDVSVREAFPNCPKYIQRRDLIAQPGTSPSTTSEHGAVLDAERRSFIERVDTLFVASCHPTRGVDVSHRGGAAGFVRVTGERTLRVPDYPGNSMFQTLGNFEVEPRAGVLMVDFERGRLLSLTGSVTVSYGREVERQPSGGTGRYWEFALEKWIDFAMPAGLRFRFVESSPFNPPPCPLPP